MTIGSRSRVGSVAGFASVGKVARQKRRWRPSFEGSEWRERHAHADPVVRTDLVFAIRLENAPDHRRVVAIGFVIDRILFPNLAACRMREMSAARLPGATSVQDKVNIFGATRVEPLIEVVKAGFSSANNVVLLFLSSHQCSICSLNIKRVPSLPHDPLGVANGRPVLLDRDSSLRRRPAWSAPSAPAQSLTHWVAMRANREQTADASCSILRRQDSAFVRR
jgi:hypothetical protein